MKKLWTAIIACLGIILLVIGYFIFVGIRVTPLTLRIGYPVSSDQIPDNVLPEKTGTVLKCGTVTKDSALFTEVYMENDGYVTISTDDTDPRADTVLRIKRNNTKSGQECSDDIPPSDKRSKIVRWKVKARTFLGFRVKYRITIGIKTNTTPYPLKYKAELSAS